MFFLEYETIEKCWNQIILTVTYTPLAKHFIMYFRKVGRSLVLILTASEYSTFHKQDRRV